jgi:FkbM family methyltransferase
VKGFDFKVDRWTLAARVLRRAIIRRAICRPAEGAPPSALFCSYRDLIGIEVLSSGSFEQEFLELAKSIVSSHIDHGTLRSGPTIAIDVGANIGTHSLFFSTIADRVLAFEPNPPVALVCQANALAARIDRIEVFNIALSDRCGTASLFARQDGNFGWASLEICGPDRPPVSVKVEQGDDFILPRIAANERVVLLKVDVEGHEPSVFRGISKLLEQHRPIVVFESLSSAHLRSCRQILETVGYNRFEAVQRDWESTGRAGKVLSLLSGMTSIRLSPVDFTIDRFYSAVVARPYETRSECERYASAGTPLTEKPIQKDAP